MNIKPTIKPTIIKSVPIQDQGEYGTCYAHACSRNFVRTLQILSIIKSKYNEQFYLLFLYHLIETRDCEKGGSYKDLLNLLNYLKQNYNDYIFTVKSPKKVKCINQTVCNSNQKYILNLNDDDKVDFINKMDKITNYLYIGKYEYIIDNTPLKDNQPSEAIVWLLQNKLQPYLSFSSFKDDIACKNKNNGHAVILRSWNKNIIEIKNSWGEIWGVSGNKKFSNITDIACANDTNKIVTIASLIFDYENIPTDIQKEIVTIKEQFKYENISYNKLKEDKNFKGIRKYGFFQKGTYNDINKTKYVGCFLYGIKTEGLLIESDESYYNTWKNDKIDFDNGNTILITKNAIFKGEFIQDNGNIYPGNGIKIINTTNVEWPLDISNINLSLNNYKWEINKNYKNNTIIIVMVDKINICVYIKQKENKKTYGIMYNQKTDTYNFVNITYQNNKINYVPIEQKKITQPNKKKILDSIGDIQNNIEESITEISNLKEKITNISNELQKINSQIDNKSSIIQENTNKDQKNNKEEQTPPNAKDEIKIPKLSNEIVNQPLLNQPLLNKQQQNIIQETQPLLINANYIDGSIYKGSWQDNQRSGKGTQIYNDKTFYDGKWENNKRHGKGTEEDIYGNKYTGFWENNERNGNGIQEYSNGTSYNGEWKDNEYNGYGIEEDKYGNKYTGEWKDNERNGYGIQIDKYGYNYNGEWKNNIFINGNITNISQSKKNYKQTYSDGSYYEGAWENNERNGFGTYNFLQNTYTGEWKNNKRHGNGKQSYDDNTSYEGEWENNKRHGKGIQIYINKTSYNGEWINNKRHGEGKQTNSDNIIYTGTWENNRFIKGTVTINNTKYNATIDNKILNINKL